MRTLYAVVRQEYEDNRTVCLFEQQADAEAHAAELNTEHGCDYGVEPFEVYPPGQRPVRHTRHHARVIVTAQAGVDGPRVYSSTFWDYEQDPPPAEPEVTVREFPSYGGCMDIVVVGSDEAEVRRVMRDLYADALVKVRGAA